MDVGFKMLGEKLIVSNKVEQLTQALKMSIFKNMIKKYYYVNGTL